MNRIIPIIAVILFALSGCKTENPGFEKIIFHNSRCYGNCDVYHLEIKGDMSVRIYAETVYKLTGNGYIYLPDKEGYFTGKAKRSDFNRLDSIIRHIGVDTLKFDNVDCCDGIIYTIIIYREGKRIELRSMFPPEKAHHLIEVLNVIKRNSDTERTKQPFTLEGQERS